MTAPAISPQSGNATPDGVRGTVGRVLSDALPAAQLAGVFLLGWGVVFFLVEVAHLLKFGTEPVPNWIPMPGILLRAVMGFWVGRLLVRHYLPRYLLHGGTRRAFLCQAPLIIMALAACGVGVFAAGWLAERAAFGVFGWSYPRSPVFLDLLDSAAGGGLHALLAQEPWWTVWSLGMHWLIFTLWAALGAVLAAGFARARLVGLLCVPVCLLLLIAAEPAFAPLINVPFPGHELIAVPVASLLAWGLTWMLVSRAPMRLDAV